MLCYVLCYNLVLFFTATVLHSRVLYCHLQYCHYNVFTVLYYNFTAFYGPILANITLYLICGGLCCTSPKTQSYWLTMKMEWTTNGMTTLFLLNFLQQQQYISKFNLKSKLIGKFIDDRLLVIFGAFMYMGKFHF